MTPTQAAIVQAAREAGVDPAYALAVASRESDFNPLARSSKTIRGIYQMMGSLRAKYGVGDSTDPYEQAQGWMRSLPDIRATMKRYLGRDPTNEEVYLGHHYGAARAAQTLRMDPSTPVEAIFTPQEMAANPHFARAGTIGNLNASVMGDIDRRMARFGGSEAPPSSAEPADLSSFGTAVASTPADLSSFGTPVEAAASAPAQEPAAAPAQTAAAPTDLSQFGTPVS
jgi:hypothetical protein